MDYVTLKNAEADAILNKLKQEQMERRRNLYEHLVVALDQRDIEYQQQVKKEDEALKEGIYEHLDKFITGKMKRTISCAKSYVPNYHFEHLAIRHDEAFLKRVAEEIMEETGRKFTLKVCKWLSSNKWQIEFDVPRPSPVDKEVNVVEKKMRSCSLKDDDETWDSVSVPSQE
jgi:hypothetical protein